MMAPDFPWPEDPARSGDFKPLAPRAPSCLQPISASPCSKLWPTRGGHVLMSKQCWRTVNVSPQDLHLRTSPGGAACPFLAASFPLVTPPASQDQAHLSPSKLKLNWSFFHTRDLNLLFHHRYNASWESRWHNVVYCKNEKITTGNFKPNTKLY